MTFALSLHFALISADYTQKPEHSSVYGSDIAVDISLLNVFSRDLSVETA